MLIAVLEARICDHTGLNGNRRALSSVGRKIDYRGYAFENALQMMKIMKAASPEQKQSVEMITARLDGKLPPLGADAT